MSAILIAGEKGGTGKSTIACNLAIMSKLMGHDVLLLDADKQETSSAFITDRNEKGITPTPSCVQIRGKYLHKEIEDLSTRYERIIIDVGGTDSAEMRAAMACIKVKKLYSPFAPSKFDLETLVKMDHLVELARSFNPELTAYLVYNKAPTNPKVTQLEKAFEYASEFENYHHAKSIIRVRVPFQHATDHYLSVVEYELNTIKQMQPYRAKSYIPKASIEICSLYEEAFNEQFKHPIADYFPTENVAEAAEA